MTDSTALLISSVVLISLGHTVGGSILAVAMLMSALYEARK